MSEIDKFLDGDTPKPVAPAKAAPPSSQIDDFLKDAPAPARGLKGWGQDIAATAVKGAIAVPEALVGLADIPTGGRVGKFLENKDGAVGLRFKEAREIVNDWHSDATKEAQRKFQDADGVLDKTAVALQNPSLIATAVGESLPSMGLGGVAARGLMAATRLGQMGAKGAVLAGAAGEGATMAGSAAEQIRQETDDGLLTPGQAGLALATGVAGGAFGYAGGKLAQRLGIGDADTMLAQGIKGMDKQFADAAARSAANPLVAEAAIKSIPRKVIEGAIAEGFLEELPQSMAEQIFQNIALGKDWHEELDSAAVMGVLSGGAMGAGAAGFHGFRSPAATPADDAAPAPGADPAAPAAEAAPQQNPGLARVSSEFAARLQALQEQEEGDSQGLQSATTYGDAVLAQQQVVAQRQAQEQAVRDAQMAESRAVESPDDEIYQSTGATAPRPSEAMGLRTGPDAGPLENAAALSVDTGATAQMQGAAGIVANDLQSEPQAANAIPVVNFDEVADPYERAMLQRLYDDHFADGDLESVISANAELDTSFDFGANVNQLLANAGATPQEIEDAQRGQASAQAADRPGQAQENDRGDFDTELSVAKNEGDGSGRLAGAEQGEASQQPLDQQAAAPGSQAEGANVATLAQLNRKKLAEMSDDELQQLSSMLPADHSRQQKIQKAIQARAEKAQSAINEGVKADGTQTDQAQQGGAQPAQAGAAQAGQPAAPNAGGQGGGQVLGATDSASAAGDKTTPINPNAGVEQAQEAPEFTTIKTIYGDSVTVRTSDLSSDKPRLRQYTRDGKSKAVPAIHRDNLDATGEKGAALAKEAAANPLFNTITNRSGAPFGNRAAAQREVNRLGLSGTHDVVPAGNGFVGQAKTETVQAQQQTAQEAQAATENAEATTGQLMQTAKDSGKLEVVHVGDKKQADAQAAPAFSVGQRVHFTSGLYSGNQGAVESISDAGRIVVRSDAGAGFGVNPSEYSTLTEGDAPSGIRGEEPTPKAKPRALNGSDTKKAEALFRASAAKKPSKDAQEQINAATKPEASAATDFIPAPDGGLDYGEITPEMGRAMRRQAGKIRLRQGNEAWGLTHIRNRHLDQFQTLGFDSVEAFVASVAANFTAIYQRPGSALDVVFAESGTGQRLAVQLEPSVDGDFYDVKTASPIRADQFKNKKPLWERAGTSTPTAMESSPPSPRSQSGSASVPLASVDAKAAKPAAIEDFGEKLEGARKDLPPSLKEEVSDEQMASLPLSKIWPANAHEEIQNDTAAALAFAARQEIPAKPRQSVKVQRWVQKVKSFRALVTSDEALAGQLDKLGLDGLSQRVVAGSVLDGFFSKVRLLAQLPRDTWGRVEKVREYPDAVRYGEDGQKAPIPFSAVVIDGEAHQFDGAKSIGPDEVGKIKELLGTAAPKKGGLTEADFEIRTYKNRAESFINRKGDKEMRPLKTFTGQESGKQAREWLKANVAQAEAQWEAVKARDNVGKGDVRTAQNRQRVGADHRKGADVTAQMFEDAFGFRGVQFGNWVAQGAGAKDRQGLLNEAYDALMDLSLLLGVPSRAMSLDGSLGLSLGARGSGKAAAHFEPDSLVINLTKTKGAGSLAHEWFHALDNYFSRMRGGEVAFTGDNNAYRQNNFVTYKPEAAWGKTPISKYTHFMRGGQLRERLQRLPGFTYDANKTLAENAKAAGFERDPNHKEGVRPQVEKAFADLVQALNDSPMAKRASSLDKAADGYWGRIIERGARSFENYVINKMALQGYSNDFLANIRNFDEWQALGKNAERYPYLTPAEEGPVVEAFDNLFETIEARQGDDGNVGLYYAANPARRPGTAQDKAVMQAIADGKSARDVLRLVASGSKDPFLRQVARLLLKAGITPNIQFGYIGKTKKGDHIHGQYRGKSDTIAIAGSAEYAAERIFMHEAMHAATMRALAKPGLPKLQLQKLLEHVRKQKGVAVFYGTKNVDEFVAEVFTNPDFQAALRKMSAPAGNSLKTAWDGFVRILRSILGLKNDPNNALSQALELGVAAMREDMVLRKQGMRAEGAANFGADNFAALKASALDQITKSLSHPGKVSLWDKTVGTMRNLAERVPQFKPVFEAAQRFIDDVSMLANDAADFAPRLMPRVESWGDLKKKPITAADNKAVAKPLFEGTLMWARDLDGTPVTTEALNAKYRNMPADEKAQVMLRTGKLDDRVLKMWKGMPIESYEKAVASKFDSTILNPGVVWSQKELKEIFKLDDKQASLYQEARAAIDRSLDMTARTDMLRLLGDEFAGMRSMVLEQESLKDAFDLVVDTLQEEASANPDMADRLMGINNSVVNRYETATELMEKGYAPLSRFGKYTVDVVDANGERQYFGMFESIREANQMAMKMRDVFKGAAVTQGTMSEQAFKLFQGITPESLEMFGSMLGLKGEGSEAQDKAFQAYLQLAKNNHSALKRLIHRKGIDGYSEDVGRVLASFVYSNARLGSQGLNAGTMETAIEGIPKEMGELRDVAMGLRNYIQDPQEEGQAVRGMLFAQYLGGSVASAFVNMTQPFQITMPWLSQYGGMGQAAKQMARALKDMGTKGFKYEADLAKALQSAEDDGVVSPQEIHQLMAQARGTGSLRTGDGTKLGDARATAANNWERVKVAWGQPFALAEQFNRRSTFIASYRIAKAQGMADPAEFARRAVLETQFLYSKANKMRWGRGAIGGTLMTFKTYSVSYLELMHRMWNQGEPGSPERAAGRRAVGWAVAMLLLMGGAGGLPFMEDAEDLIDGAAQLMGYNLSTKQARKDFLADIVGKEFAEFIEQGASGLPGAPIDVSGRLGMGNLIPGTGLFMSKQNRERDLMEIAGPAGDLVARGFTGARKALTGDVAGAALEMSPTAVRNAAKGIDMATSGIYKDTKGYKVMDVTLAEAASKFLGFQPKSVAEDGEASSFKQRTKSFYIQTSADIKAQWADAIFRKDDAALERVRERLSAWNRNNPDLPITVKIPDIMKRVREMGKDREQRINDTAPKALRQQFREMSLEANR